MMFANKHLVEGKWLNVLNVIQQVKCLHVNGMEEGCNSIGKVIKDKTLP